MEAKLVMFKRDGQRKEFSLRGKSTVIGRGEECTLRIPLAAVSRRHAELIKGEDELRVRDLASSNGTYVNNRRINETALKAGDRLAVGPIVFTLQIDGVPEEISPVRSKSQKAPVGPEEDIVELEPDTAKAAGGGGEEEEVDPIAALEALASDQKKKPKK